VELVHYRGGTRLVENRATTPERRLLKRGRSTPPPWASGRPSIAPTGSCGKPVEKRHQFTPRGCGSTSRGARRFEPQAGRRRQRAWHRPRVSASRCFDAAFIKQADVLRSAPMAGSGWASRSRVTIVRASLWHHRWSRARARGTPRPLIVLLPVVVVPSKGRPLHSSAPYRARERRP